ncbi:ribosomal protein S18-alanine N-acetyltransferase [Desertibacillus haloalkaliphilus]|uniref:ribosomal protein S18-alanine N-acetyltransferase n=1 Tax=Desertibacillus haloalkaliphilus TaxID=1328930 RepID=UPI001C27E645|nr:ribosomal protein S18-alanine N-acetyltransferase [Desertibacillus haloalkaliphilus]MBU8908566.1 ribosomal protein S18-alanine N-acetyltransferase [Desertibacillus haloalkaliphilus]
MEEKCTIRLMSVEDIEDVIVVEQDAFPVPWSREAFQNELTNNQFAHYLVVEVDGKVVGYCGVWVVIDEAHITNIAIHSNYRGKKFGEILLIHALDLAKTFGAKKMTLEVRVSNEIAKQLYEKLGFQSGGIRKKYYTDNLEDALIMWVMLNGNEAG